MHSIYYFNFPIFIFFILFENLIIKLKALLCIKLILKLDILLLNIQLQKLDRYNEILNIIL